MCPCCGGALGVDGACEACAALRVASRKARAARIERHYQAAFLTLTLARRYAKERESSGRRERECIAVVQTHRAMIRALRAGNDAVLHDLEEALTVLPSGLARPGLRRAEPRKEVRRDKEKKAL